MPSCYEASAEKTEPKEKKNQLKKRGTSRFRKKESSSQIDIYGEEKSREREREREVGWRRNSLWEVGNQKLDQ